MIVLFPPAIALTIPSDVLELSGPLAEDVVAVYDQSYNQMFPMARPVKINVTPRSKLMDHPIEDGSVITDFRIILQTEVELAVLCTGESYQDVFQEVKAAYLSGEVFTIVDKADTYFNMMVETMPYDLTSDMYDGIPIGVRFREIQLVAAQYQPLAAADVKNTDDQSTMNTGETTPKEAPKSSAAAYLFPNALK